MPLDVAAALARLITEQPRELAACLLETSHFASQDDEDDIVTTLYTSGETFTVTPVQPAPHGHRFTVTLPTGDSFVVTVDADPSWDLNTQENP